MSLPTETLDHKRTQTRRIACSIIFGILSLNPYVGLISFLSFLTGWGFPVSAAIRKNDKPWEAEWTPLDWLTTLLVGRQVPSDYGLMWLTLHGLIAGIVLACLTLNPTWLVLCLMGYCYYLTKDGEWGELAYGAVWGAIIAYSYYN